MSAALNSRKTHRKTPQATLFVFAKNNFEEVIDPHHAQRAPSCFGKQVPSPPGSAHQARSPSLEREGKLLCHGMAFLSLVFNTKYSLGIAYSTSLLIIESYDLRKNHVMYSESIYGSDH